MDSYEPRIFPCWSLSHLAISSKAKWLSVSNVTMTSKTTLGSEAISDNWKPFKNFEKCFLFHVKGFFVCKVFTFLSWLFGHIWKCLDKKSKSDFKVCDVIDLETNNYKTYIALYFNKWSLSGSRIVRNIVFENHAENQPRRIIPDHFVLFLKKVNSGKASGQHLSFNIFWTWHVIKANFIPFLLIQRYT